MPSHTAMPMLCSLLLVTKATPHFAATPPKSLPNKVPATQSLPALDDRLTALLAATPGLTPEQARQRVPRLEEAWRLAKARGLLAGPAWIASLEAGRVAILARTYLDKQPGHPGPTDAQIQAAYLAQGEQRQVSHILCTTREDAEAALQRVRNGASMDQVALEVSRDPSASLNHGDLGWVRQKDLVMAFGDPVFAAPVGALVGPLKSEYGWHVARVMARRVPTVESFAAERSRLLKQAVDSQQALQREAALVPLRKRYPLVADRTVLGADRTTELLPGDESKVAGRVAGVPITLKDLKHHLVDVLKTMGQSHSLGADTKARFMEGLADPIRLATAARRLGLDHQPAVRASLWVDARERAYARYAEAYLTTLTVPEADLKSHHAAHPDRFRQVGGLRIQVLVADSRDRVDEALAMVRGGMGWREAVARYGNAEATGTPEPSWIEVTALERLVPPSLMQPLLQGALDQVVGPMLGPDGFMLFRVLERRPGQVEPFEACREAVRSDYLRERGPDLVIESLDHPLMTE